ncbi:MAG: M48 family metalloprotease [Tepidisphaera sp.]
MVAAIAVAGYFAYNKFVKGPAQTVSDAADKAKGAADKVIDTLKTGKDGKPPDAQDRIRGIGDLAGSLGRTATDIANGLVGLSIDEEWKHGEVIRAEILKQFRVSTDLSAQQRIEKLAQPILAQLVRTKGRRYTFTLIEDSTMNAFAFVGGNVFIFRGLLDEMKSDVAIQSVIGHEIGHVELEHCAKGSLAGIRAAEIGGNLAGNIASQLQNIIVLGYSEDQEFESDKYAYEAQRKLGVPKADRIQFVRVLEAFAQKNNVHDDLDKKASTPAGEAINAMKRHYRSHPAGNDRVKRLEDIKD